MKRLMTLLVIFILVGFSLSSYSKEVKIYVLNTGDIHESSDNLDAIKKFIDKKRKDHPGQVILVDAGDLLTQFPFPSYTKEKEKAARKWAPTLPKGEQMIEWVKARKYDAIVPGNHDFIVGENTFQKYVKDLAIPFTCANLSDDNLLKGVPKYRTVTSTVDGVTLEIGIIGIADQEKDSYHFPKDSSGKSPQKDKLKTYPVYNPTMENLLKKVAGETAFTIILSHNEDKVDKDSIAALTAKIPKSEVCVIVGGHSHSTMAEKIPDARGDNSSRPCIIKSGVHGENVGVTTITWDTAKLRFTKVTVKNCDPLTNKYSKEYTWEPKL